MLHREGFLRSKGQPPTPSERAMRKLSAWNPEVGFFHSATRDLMFASLDEARSYRQERSEPWVGSVYAPRGIRRTLPVPHAPSPVSAAFLDRRSWRRFAKKTLSLDHLSTLLWLSGGVQKWATTPAGRFALKTGPSGGALHPIELYVMVRRVEGLAPGFYHYGGDRHRLTRLTRHAKPASVLRYLPQQPWFEPAAAIVFLVAHYERCLWRYKYARAYRAPFIEAGHVAQTFCTIATSLGLAPFVSMALADSNIEHEIGADGITRAVLYATGVGHRPGNVAHANMPEGITTVRVTDNHPRSGRRR
jgi:SagB-type dehydrogenase family enzyme